MPVKALLDVFREEIEKGKVAVPRRILEVLRDRGLEAEPAIPFLIEILKKKFSVELDRWKFMALDRSDDAISVRMMKQRFDEVLPEAVIISIDLGWEALDVLEAIGTPAALALIREAARVKEDDGDLF